MDVSIAYIEFTFQHGTAITLEYRGRDLARTRLATLRKELLTTYAPLEDHAPNKWTLRVDEQEVTWMDAGNRYGHNNGMKVALHSKGPRSGTQKRALPSPAPTAEAGPVYSPLGHLERLLAANERVYQEERADNGVAGQFVHTVLGHIWAAREQLHLQSMDVVLQTEARQSGLAFVLARPTVTLTIAPHLVPGHVSLLCRLGSGRLLHLDSSSSFASLNAELFREPASKLAVSYTYVNYQMYDVTGHIANATGGNCGMFSSVNALHILLAGGERQARRVTFEEFWPRFLNVLNTYTPADRQQRVPLAVHTMRNILYVASGNAAREHCHDIHVAPLVPYDALDVFPAYLRSHHGAWLRSADFSADSYMLDYFEQNALGFNAVARIGSVMQVQLRDLVQRGFGEFLTGGDNRKRQALMASLRVLISSLCQACYEQIPITAASDAFVGCCQSCDRRYCSAVCMSVGDLSE